MGLIILIKYPYRIDLTRNYTLLKGEFMKTVIVTGAAGFVGSFLIEKLLEQNVKVIGIDNLNDYYDVNLKLERLKKIRKK